MSAEDFDGRYTDYQTNRSRLRKLIRRAYLHSARKKLSGATLDFGCGVGELLELLPEGSQGLEYNAATVDYCIRKGLDVCWYDGYADDWALSSIDRARRFDSMVISHVLEHLDQPMAVLSSLLTSAARLGVRRALVIVPGRAGFHIDSTHRTFVDLAMVRSADPYGSSGFRLHSSSYFPGDARILGEWLPHHELQMLLTRD